MPRTAPVPSDPERRPVLRLLPTPGWEPPYEEPGIRRRGATDLTQGTLALTFVLPTGIPAVPEPPALRLVPAAGTDTCHEGLFDPQPTSSACLPDARFWAARLTQAVLEVDAGIRPVAQLRRWTSDAVYAQLRHRDSRARVAAARQDLRARQQTRVAVRSLRVCEPADGVAEISAVVYDGRRPRALALRLEGSDGRWRCTALEHV